MIEHTHYSVLDAIWTVSGKMIVVLNSFDDPIGVGSKLSNEKGMMWIITKSENFNLRGANTQQRANLLELGAKLFHIEPVEHNELPKTGEDILLKANDS